MELFHCNVHIVNDQQQAEDLEDLTATVETNGDDLDKAFQRIAELQEAVAELREQNGIQARAIAQRYKENAELFRVMRASIEQTNEMLVEMSNLINRVDRLENSKPINFFNNNN